MSGLINQYLKIDEEQFSRLKELNMSDFIIEDYRHMYWMANETGFRYFNTKEEVNNFQPHFGYTTPILKKYPLEGYIIIQAEAEDSWYNKDSCYILDPSKRVDWVG